MNTKPHIYGIHHITAVASSAAQNLAFYEQALGLRLVKRTVNFDDPYAYHFYFGDASGSPGTILTFFPWERLPKGRPGAGMVTAIAFAVDRSSMAYWSARLNARGVGVAEEERFGDPVIRFEDRHGLPLEIVGLDVLPATEVWQAGPVEPQHALRGFHSATATLNSVGEAEALLTDVMGLSLVARQDDRSRYAAGGEMPGRFYDIVHAPEARAAQPGGGTVHHIAFRVRDEDEQLQWQSLLRRSGMAVTGVRDRNYFRSIYFQSPGGVLFEIATNPPGFMVDETAQRLGAGLSLPAQYEPLRREIEPRLPALRESYFAHLFEPAQSAADDGHTLVTLHGTGGNEHDLVQMAREVSGVQAIISPRGRVLEKGMPRYFKRLANNVFDEADVIERAHELAGFLADAVIRYGRDADRLTAVGYSNGANMAAAMLLLRPEVFSSAVLLRPMVPLQNRAIPDLDGKVVLVLKGDFDAVIPSASTDQLIRMLVQSGAQLTVREIRAGHEITSDDIHAMSQWFAGLKIDRRSRRDNQALGATA